MALPEKWTAGDPTRRCTSFATRPVSHPGTNFWSKSGTANEFAKYRTNVIKLYSTLVQAPEQQVTYYHPGIGTMEPFGSLSPITRMFTRVLAMAVGYHAFDIQDCLGRCM